MRRSKVSLLCLVLLLGGCKTLHTVAEVAVDVVVPVAIIAGAAFAEHEIWHHHGHHGHHWGHSGHHGRRHR